MGLLASRLGNPLRWSLVDRCLLVVLFTLPFGAGFALRALYLIGHPEVEPYYDRVGLRALCWLLLGTAGFWAALAAVGVRLRVRSPENAIFAHVAAQSWWLWAVLVSYFVGVQTSPIWILPLFGGFFFLLMFPQRVVFPALFTALLAFLALGALQFTGRISYAPIFAALPWEKGELAREYFAGSTLSALLPTIVFFGIFAYLVARWREQEALLAATEREMREARDGLEQRVAERTQELRSAYGRLEGEMRERGRLQEQLVESQKLEAVGRLTSGIAHEFNNLLAVILGRNSLAAQKAKKGADPAADLAAAAKASEQAAELVKKLLSFGRRQTLRREVILLNAVVSETMGLLRPVLPANIRFAAELPEGVPAVRVDRGQLIQILLNLAMNAQDAMKEGGELILQTADVRLTESIQEGDEEIPAGDYAVLRVRDTGQGMDKAVLKHIFEPFFTTKGVGAGTGLGLSMVYGAVKQHGGFIYVRSEPGRGSTFEILLPAAAEEGRPAENPAAPAPAIGRGSLRVLLAEDDPQLRLLIQQVMAGEGYEVFAAANGAEALKIFDEPGSFFDLLISDIVMPQMGGLELVKQLRQRGGNLKILLISGYSEVSNGGIPEGCAYLAKPFTPEKLLARIGEIVIEDF